MATDLMKYRENAQRVQQRYRQQAAEINADQDLSAEGKARKLAEVYMRTQRELDELLTQEQATRVSRRQQLESDLYNGRPGGVDPASHAISVRDAADRVAMLQSPDEAARLMRSAESTGDTVLARAILRRIAEQEPTGGRGIDQAWHEVAQGYVERHGEVQSAVAELAEIESMGRREIFSPFTATPPSGVAPQFLNAAADVVPSGASA